jgi:hypothetical protein
MVVGSTFDDLTANRDALQQHFFPRLHELAGKNEVWFQVAETAHFSQLIIALS